MVVGGGGSGQIQQYPDKLGLDATQSFFFFVSLHLLPWVGDISSSFLGEVRSKNDSYIPIFYPLQHLPQSTELKLYSNQVLHISTTKSNIFPTVACQIKGVCTTMSATHELWSVFRISCATQTISLTYQLSNMPPLLMFFFMSLLQSPSQLSTQSYVWKKYRKGVALIYLDLRPKKYPDQFPACEGGQSYFQCYRKNIFKCSALLLFHKGRKKQDTLKHSMEGSSQQNNNIHEVCTTWVPTSNNCYG